MDGWRTSGTQLFTQQIWQISSSENVWHLFPGAFKAVIICFIRDLTKCLSLDNLSRRCSIFWTFWTGVHCFIGDLAKSLGLNRFHRLFSFNIGLDFTTLSSGYNGWKSWDRHFVFILISYMSELFDLAASLDYKPRYRSQIIMIQGLQQPISSALVILSVIYQI